MGQITDNRISDFQEQSGIKPATGKRAKRLRQMSKHAYELIQVLALEQAGIRHGDGHWHGTDPIMAIIQHLDFLNRADTGGCECGHARGYSSTIIGEEIPF